jgi:transcriptional regulator with GAF, ATPase, and Fis domain
LERASTLLIDASVSLSRAERGFVFLVENGNIDLAIGRNFAREPVPAPEKKLSRTLLERAMDHDGPLLIRDAAHDGDFAGVASISDLGLRSLLAIPLRHGGDLLGVLMVDHRMASGAFKQEELVLLNGLADAASTALGAVRDRSRSAKLRRQVSRLKRQLGRRVQAESEEERRLAGLKSLRFGNIVGASPQLSELFRDMERLMESDASILIQGESGSGKELVARAIHDGGLRSGKPFVVENCGALPDTLLESELFGHLKGAFTGATCDKKGRFEEAHRGTLFLDEVGEMSEAMQQRLLRVLENGEIRRLGSSEIKQVDVRIIAATNRDLRTEVDEGRFREDLFFRLNVLLLELPPLRDRDGDIPLLAEHFLALEGAELGRPRRTLTPGAVAHLESLAWPGNVRQLHNEMRRLSLMGEGEIQPEELSSELAPLSSLEEEVTDSTGTLPERIGRLEKLWIQESLDRQHGNRTKAAKELGLTRYTLLRKIEKYEMDGGKGAPPE